MTIGFIELDLLQRKNVNLDAYLKSNDHRIEAWKQEYDKQDGKVSCTGAQSVLLPIGDNLVIMTEDNKGETRTLATLDGNTKYLIQQDFETVKDMLTSAGVLVIESPTKRSERSLKVEGQAAKPKPPV